MRYAVVALLGACGFIGPSGATGPSDAVLIDGALGAQVGTDQPTTIENVRINLTVGSNGGPANGATRVSRLVVCP